MTKELIHAIILIAQHTMKNAVDAAQPYEINSYGDVVDCDGNLVYDCHDISIDDADLICEFYNRYGYLEFEPMMLPILEALNPKVVC